ncbi:M60 family metallopeptidase [Luteolibacter soli]
MIVSSGKKSGPSWGGVAAALVVFGGGVVAFSPGVRSRVFGADTTSKETLKSLEKAAKAPAAKEETAAPAETKVAAKTQPTAPVAAATEPAAPSPIAADPAPLPPAAPAAPAEATPAPPETAATLESASPEIARAFQTTLERISAAPDKVEDEARLLLRGLFAKSNGKTRAADLAKDHPELLLGLLGDLWARVEEAAGARLPAVTRISIRSRSANKATDLTETYVKLLSPEKAGEAAGADKLSAIARSPELGKLLQHFTEAEDSGTIDNALTLGRMVHALRQGKVPLADAPAAVAQAADPDSLPDVKKSVDLADFKDVRELVRWAHGFNPSAKAKVKVPTGSEAEQILARVKAYLALPPEALLAHPGAAEFPGAVPANAPRVEKQVSIDLNMPRWQATGLYAPPGGAITVAVPAPLRKLGLKLRIGADTDNILKTSGEEENNLSRFPMISREIALDDARVTAGNPFGGAIYIDVPFGNNGGAFQVPAHGWTIRPFDKMPSPEVKALSIAGGVEMAWWRAGMTPSAWHDELKKPAPWAELELGMLHTSVPRDSAAEVRNPAELAAFWDQVMDAQWKFAGYPGYRYIPMRVSFDRQISAGFMHSGYPIMVHVPEVKEVLDLKKLQTEGSWGLYHEIGHNHQPVCITPSGFTESTVNLFTLATLKATIPKRDPIAGHDALSDAKGLLKKRQAGEEDAWINLSLFLPLIDEFGYESITRTLTGYWTDARKDSSAINLSNEERQDQWTLRFGETVQRDVSEYFESVRYKVSPATKKKLSKYPVWKP